MIDIEKAKMFYKKYISNYDIDNPRINLKVAHIYRVSERAREIAESIELSEEDVKLAQLIGILHDIGRFEQVKTYNTFSDRDSVNHAELGLKILFEDGVIKDFLSDRSYDSIIYKAIINHNKDIIENELSEREILHSKIIRDADKLDIFNVISYENIEIAYGCSNILTQPITNKIYNQFLQNHIVKYKDMKQKHDLIMANLAYVFDINYIYTLNKIEENNYIERILKRFEFKNDILKEQIDTAYKQVKEYITNKLIEG